jgi:chaperone BCS1
MGYALSGELNLRNFPRFLSALSLQQTEEGLWKRTKDFDVSLKSSQRKWAVSMFDEVGAKQSADYVPKWLKPVLFRWKGHWVDVSRLDGGTSVRGAPGGFGSMKLQ